MVPLIVTTWKVVALEPIPPVHTWGNGLLMSKESPHLFVALGSLLGGINPFRKLGKIWDEIHDLEKVHKEGALLWYFYIPSDKKWFSSIEWATNRYWTCIWWIHSPLPWLTWPHLLPLLFTLALQIEEQDLPIKPLISCPIFGILHDPS